VDNFDLTVDSSRGTALVCPSGELDLASAPTLWSALAGLRKDGHRSVDMDLSRLTFSDCAGLRPIFRARRHGTVVQLRDAIPAVRRVLDLTGLGVPAALA
jgi:anti-anti-sigma factor